MIKLEVGGVPEHFNLPWHLALEAARFAPFKIDLRWRDYPDGSGAMAKALRQGELDAALLLTEGAVAGIADAPQEWSSRIPANCRPRHTSARR